MIEPGFMNPTILKNRRRTLRKNPTQAEEFLWKYLRNNFLGVKISRQVGIGSFIVDFCCRSQRLIIEIDGEIHDALEIAEYDGVRGDILEKLGYKILRFKNKEVFDNTMSVIQTIKNNLTPLPTPREGQGAGVL